MAIDQYAICPCGSGKKIKFCKCFESIGELDKVMKMVQGSQLVAALDRLNQIFKQHPTAAWTLAIKGRLLLGMNEVKNLEENADRFIRLQPSNPLALAQKAAALAAQNKLSEAAHSILQALAESGQSVDPLIIEICGVLAVSLAQSGNFLSGRMFATIALMASQDPVLQRLPRAVLEELNGSDHINLLLKTLPTTVARPASVPWGERFDEAQALLYSNQILASESKLEALDRQHPNEPAIMMSLFVCAIWRADLDAQSRWLAKVSEALGGDHEKSIRLLAISWLLASKSQALDIRTQELVFELEDAEKAILELTAAERIGTIPNADLRNVQNEDGIRPRAAFAVLDKPLSNAAASELGAADEYALLLGLAFIFGRQTDKPAQMVIRQVLLHDADTVKQQIFSVVHGARLVETSGDQAFQPVPLSVALAARVYLSSSSPQPPPSDEVNRELQWKILSEKLLKYSLDCLHGKSLSDLLHDAATIKQRSAFVRILQGEMAMLHETELVRRFSEMLGVTPLAPIAPKSDEELELLPAFDLMLVEIDSLDQESLFYYFERCSQAGINEHALQAAAKITAIETTDEESLEMIMRAYVSLISSTLDHQQALKYAKEGVAWCARHQVADASLLLSAVPRYLFASDGPGFSNAVQELQRKYGTNQEVMTHLARMLVDLGVLNPDGSPRRAPVPAPKSGNAVWTGQDTAPAPSASGVVPPAESAPSGGGSKLWLPGMD